MIGLSDLASSHTHSWAAAQEAFDWPTVENYNIAADCLSADPAKTALIEVNETSRRELTFRQLNEQSAAFGAGLVGLGVQPGDRVAIKLSQSAQMAIAVLAVLRIGGIVVPISNVLGEDALRHRFEDSAPRVVVSAGSPAELVLTAEVDAIAVTTTDSPGECTMQQLIEAAPVDSETFAPTEANTPALLLFTSGTTGNSKGVLHGHRVLLGHHAIDLALDHVRDDDVAYSPVDWAWAGGLLLGLLVPLARGLTVVAYRDTHFSAERTIDVLRTTGVSVGLFPPTALRILRRSGNLTKAVLATLRLRSLVLGAEAVEPELTDWARDELGISVNNAYGQTEANSLIGHATVLGPLDRDCLGRAYPGHTIAILDADLNECNAGDTGEIAVRADDPVCMLRYWNAPEATAKKIRSGWLLTGDAAHADAHHQIYFHGRTDDIIKSGGYRIGPAEIEAALMANPAVVECAAIGVPDPVRGQAVAAFVKLADDVVDTDALTKQLQELVRARVGAYAYPRIVFYVNSLPRTTAGKIDRKALRHESAQGTQPEASR
ncbi:MAG: AMP-binding protein [Nakamurella sp.]